MEHGHRALETRIGEVRVELRQVLRHHHALEDDGVGREARHIERGIAARGLLGQAARHEEPPVESRLVEARLKAVDEELLDEGQRFQRLGATGPRVHRHGAPAGHLESLPRQLASEREPRLLRLLRIARVKHETGGEALGELDAGLGGHRPEKPLRPLQQQPAAVAGLAVGSDRAAVSETNQGADRGANQPVARRIVQARDQAEAATVALVALFIESGGRGIHG